MAKTTFLGKHMGAALVSAPAELYETLIKAKEATDQALAAAREAQRRYDAAKAQLAEITWDLDPDFEEFRVKELAIQPSTPSDPTVRIVKNESKSLKRLDLTTLPEEVRNLLEEVHYYRINSPDKFLLECRADGLSDEEIRSIVQRQNRRPKKKDADEKKTNEKKTTKKRGYTVSSKGLTLLSEETRKSVMRYLSLTETRVTPKEGVKWSDIPGEYVARTPYTVILED